MLSQSLKYQLDKKISIWLSTSINDILDEKLMVDISCHPERDARQTNFAFFFHSIHTLLKSSHQYTNSSTLSGNMFQKYQNAYDAVS